MGGVFYQVSVTLVCGEKLHAVLKLVSRSQSRSLAARFCIVSAFPIASTIPNPVVVSLTPRSPPCDMHGTAGVRSAAVAVAARV